jgi:GntR family transcriptional regulator/MocR family aminotransferase
VNSVLPDDLLEVRARATRSSTERPPRRAVTGFGRRASPFPVSRFRRVRAFRANQPALNLFPTDVWAQIASRRLRRATTSQLLGSGPLGYPPLQEAVAGYLRTSRGVNCTAPQIAIVSGLQEALDLTARLFLNPGDRVCMENPGYIGARIVFEAHGAKVDNIAVDNEGMELPKPSLTKVRVAYVTPAHQFPLGMSMTVARRLALLEWARSSGALIFEDDYDSEYRYSGRPLPALQGLDRHGVVIFAGSFSKVMFPSIRLGYVVVPSDLVDLFAATRSITSRHESVLDQAILCDFIESGHFGRHVRRMREVYAERLSVLLEEAGDRLSGLLEISPVEAGLQTVGWLMSGIDPESAAHAAAERDVEVVPLGRYARGKVATSGLQIGFAAVDRPEIKRGVRELAIALEGELKRPARQG